MSETEDPVSSEQDLPEYVIEGARSSRSRCKACRRPIQMGTLRIGIRIEGPFGTGYLWFHLKCAAKRQIDRVEEAYAMEAWKAAKVPPAEVPTIEELRTLVAQAEAEKKEQKKLPHVEIAPTSRSRCKHCQEPIAEGDARVALARAVTFGRQVRTTAITIHPRCVAAALRAEDNATEAETLREDLLENSAPLTRERIEQVLAEIGDYE
jgi:hypothetical protein